MSCMPSSFIASVNNTASPRGGFNMLAPCSPWNNATASIPTSPISPTRSF